MDATPPPDPGADSVLTPDVDVTAQATPVDRRAPTPDLEKTGQAFAGERVRSAGITTLAVLAVLYTIYFAQSFLLPIVVALLLSFLF
ncbi:MAG TPA: hypothetical protein VK689_10940, partial [Armatimonadota bacterium]|nr:hypothetical protein [Armatimonadota bacterium]